MFDFWVGWKYEVVRGGFFGKWTHGFAARQSVIAKAFSKMIITGLISLVRDGG